MFGMAHCAYLGMNPAASSVWKIWVDFILQFRSEFAFSKAAIVDSNKKKTSAASSDFTFSSKEISSIRAMFDGPSLGDKVIKLQKRSYIVQYLSKEQMVAFYGRHNIIATRVKPDIYVIVLCDERDKCNESLDWLLKLSKILRERANELAAKR